MWQTIATIIVLVCAAVYAARHFLKVYRTGNDPGCSGCSCSGCCEEKRNKDSDRKEGLEKKSAGNLASCPGKEGSQNGM